MMVGEELQVLASARRKFTAYDVTRALRRREPHANILHAEVRALVHQFMDQLVGADEYEAELRNFGWNTAIQYKPSRGRSKPGIPGVPLLPLN